MLTRYVLLPSLLCFLAAVTAGCGGGSDSGASNGLSGPDPQDLVKTAVTADGLTATLRQPTATVAPGTLVVYTLTLTNTTTQPYTFLAPVGRPDARPIPVFGFQIKDSSGNTLPPTLGSTPAVVLAPFPVTLQPGEAATTTEQVNSYTQTGRYQATAAFYTGVSANVATDAGPLTIFVH